MTVYVDDMYLHEVGNYGRMKMSHMIADTQEDLLQMARKIGVHQKWIQHKGEPGEHFDVCMSMRAKAIKLGAVQVTMRQCALMCWHRRLYGTLGTPTSVEAKRKAYYAEKSVQCPESESSL
jgi:hypothetical protein